MYRYFILFLALPVFTNAQKSIIGEYKKEIPSVNQIQIIDIKSDSTIEYICYGGLEPDTKEFGKWYRKADTLFISWNDSSTSKWLIEDEYFINTVVKNKEIKNDTVLLFMPSLFKKIKSYYPNGKLKSEMYWESYNIYSYNENKGGTWKYYNEKGELIKTEFYRKGKLKKSKYLNP